FNFEQFDNHLRAGPAEVKLGSASVGANVFQDGAYAITHTENLAPNQLIAREETLGIVAQVHNNVVAGDFLYGATDELAKAITVLVNNLRPLGFPNSLHDDLLGCLSSDAAKLYVLDKLFVDIAGLQ